MRVRGCFVSAVALALAGCGWGTVESSGDPTAGNTSSIRLSLSGDSSGLHLSGAPLDPAYVGTYPNPRGLRAMTVEFFPNGSFQSSCTSATGQAACSDPPFTARARPAAQGISLEVADLFGQPIARGEFPTAYQNQAGGGGGDCAGFRDQLRAEYCQRVNDLLPQISPGYTLDCGVLGDGSLFPPSLPSGWQLNPKTYLISCNDIVFPPFMMVEQELEGRLGQNQCSQLGGLPSVWMSDARLTLMGGGACGHSPLVVDVAGNGIRLSSPDQGVSFDLLATGEPVRCSWTEGDDDAFLVLDRNGNGVIDGAAEMFGNSTAGESFADGFAALATLDANHDGRIDARDPAFARLRLWQDRDRDGRSRPAELVRLEHAGIAAIELQAHRRSDEAARDAQGNSIPLVGAFVRVDGSRGLVVDAFLRFEPSRTMIDSQLTERFVRRLAAVP